MATAVVTEGLPFANVPAKPAPSEVVDVPQKGAPNDEPKAEERAKKEAPKEDDASVVTTANTTAEPSEKPAGEEAPKEEEPVAAPIPGGKHSASSGETDPRKEGVPKGESATKKLVKEEAPTEVDAGVVLVANKTAKPAEDIAMKEVPAGEDAVVTSIAKGKHSAPSEEVEPSKESVDEPVIEELAKEEMTKGDDTAMVPVAYTTAKPAEEHVMEEAPKEEVPVPTSISGGKYFALSEETDPPKGSTTKDKPVMEKLAKEAVSKEHDTAVLPVTKTNVKPAEDPVMEEELQEEKPVAAPIVGEKRSAEEASVAEKKVRTF